MSRGDAANGSAAIFRYAHTLTVAIPRAGSARRSRRRVDACLQKRRIAGYYWQYGAGAHAKHPGVQPRTLTAAGGTCDWSDNTLIFKL